MIGIRSIASYIPGQSIDNVQQARVFGEGEEFARTKVGALQLPRKAENEDTSDLGSKALSALIAKSGLRTDEIGAVVLVTQNGDGAGLPHTSAIVHQKLGLPRNAAVFDISLGCSGYVYGLSVLSGFMQASGLDNGVLITADPYSKIVNSKDKNTTLLFGDAATATWLNRDPEWTVLPGTYMTDGGGAKNLMVENGSLTMNGRQVFNFALINVPIEIKRLLEREKMNESDIDLFCLHQGSASIVDGISRQFPSVKSRFVLDMERTGNTVSSSIPLLLEKHLDSSHMKNVLLSGFGVGLSIASTIIQRKE